MMPGGLRLLFGSCFGAEEIQVEALGNILTGIGHWCRMAVQDLPRRAFQVDDPNFPVIVGVRARKGA